MTLEELGINIVGNIIGIGTAILTWGAYVGVVWADNGNITAFAWANYGCGGASPYQWKTGFGDKQLPPILNPNFNYQHNQPQGPTPLAFRQPGVEYSDKSSYNTTSRPQDVRKNVQVALVTNVSDTVTKTVFKNMGDKLTQYSKDLNMMGASLIAPSAVTLPVSPEISLFLATKTMGSNLETGNKTWHVI